MSWFLALILYPILFKLLTSLVNTILDSGSTIIIIKFLTIDTDFSSVYSRPRLMCPPAGDGESLRGLLVRHLKNTSKIECLITAPHHLRALLPETFPTQQRDHYLLNSSNQRSKCHFWFLSSLHLLHPIISTSSMALSWKISPIYVLHCYLVQATIISCLTTEVPSKLIFLLLFLTLTAFFLTISQNYIFINKNAILNLSLKSLKSKVLNMVHRILHV